MFDTFPAAPAPSTSPALRRLFIGNPYSHRGSSVLRALPRTSDVATLDQFQLSLSVSHPENEISSLCDVLKPGFLRVTCSAEKIWTAELGDARRVLTFPGAFAGPVLSALLQSVSQYVRRIEADETFCDRLVRCAQQLPRGACSASRR